VKKLIIILFIVFIFPLSINSYTATDTADSIVKSLKTEPHKWVYDQYKLYYFKDPKVIKSTVQHQWDDVADCVIWIANQEYGIEVKAPAKVVLPKESRAFIWETYQKWANGHFAKVFENPFESEIVEEHTEKIKSNEPESNESEFVSLTTDKIKVEKKPNDFFSLIPKWVRTLMIGIVIVTAIGSLSFGLFNFFRNRKIKGEL
jgi:hypothetical protein